MSKVKGDDLIGKMIKASQVVSEKRQGEGDYIVITEERIGEMAIELGVSFDEMVIILKNYFEK
jgi:hypothetical protein